SSDLPCRYILTHPKAKFKVELFLLSDDPHDQTRFARRKQVTIAGRLMYVPTPEDVIVTKLRWSRGGGRAKDIGDIENVLAVQRDKLDLPYIRTWCDQHNTRELFEKLLQQAGCTSA